MRLPAAASPCGVCWENGGTAGDTGEASTLLVGTGDVLLVQGAEWKDNQSGVRRWSRRSGAGDIKELTFEVDTVMTSMIFLH